MSWPKKFPLGSPRNDFRDPGQGVVPPQMASLRNENLRTLWRVAESEYQSRPDRIVKSTKP
jgi:hypothetical protein